MCGQMDFDVEWMVDDDYFYLKFHFHSSFISMIKYLSIMIYGE